MLKLFCYRENAWRKMPSLPCPWTSQLRLNRTAWIMITALQRRVSNKHASPCLGPSGPKTAARLCLFETRFSYWSVRRGSKLLHSCRGLRAWFLIDEFRKLSETHINSRVSTAWKVSRGICDSAADSIHMENVLSFRCLTSKALASGVSHSLWAATCFDI